MGVQGLRCRGLEIQGCRGAWVQGLQQCRPSHGQGLVSFPYRNVFWSCIYFLVLLPVTICPPRGTGSPLPPVPIPALTLPCPFPTLDPAVHLRPPGLHGGHEGAQPTSVRTCHAREGAAGWAGKGKDKRTLKILQTKKNSKSFKVSPYFLLTFHPLL